MLELECAQEIMNALGSGYNECVYHKAFEVCLRNRGVDYESERIVPIILIIMLLEMCEVTSS